MVGGKIDQVSVPHRFMNRIDSRTDSLRVHFISKLVKQSYKKFTVNSGSRIDDVESGSARASLLLHPC